MWRAQTGMRRSTPIVFVHTFAISLHPHTRCDKVNNYSAGVPGPSVSSRSRRIASSVATRLSTGKYLPVCIQSSSFETQSGARKPMPGSAVMVQCTPSEIRTSTAVVVLLRISAIPFERMNSAPPVCSASVYAVTRLGVTEVAPGARVAAYSLHGWIKVGGLDPAHFCWLSNVGFVRCDVAIGTARRKRRHHVAIIPDTHDWKCAPKLPRKIAVWHSDGAAWVTGCTQALPWSRSCHIPANHETLQSPLAVQPRPARGCPR